MQILHKYLFECKVIKKNFNYQIFSSIFYISPYKTCKKANIHSFFEQSYRFSCIFYIGFRYIYTSHTKYPFRKKSTRTKHSIDEDLFRFLFESNQKASTSGFAARHWQLSAKPFPTYYPSRHWHLHSVSRPQATANLKLYKHRHNEQRTSFARDNFQSRVPYYY